jgi:polysaccharide pyruvyl transferase WcaK-like protein
MPVALLAGAFGQGNLGDEALMHAFVKALPEWHLAVTTSDPAATERAGCEAVPARRPTSVARRALGADAIVLGGGTVFKTLHPSSARRPLALLANASALVAAASMAHRPVAMVGVGAAHFDDRRAQALTRFVVRHGDLLILRDDESAAEMARAGAPGPFRVGADPAWTLLDPPCESRASPEHSVRVVPSALATGTDGWPGMIDRVADTVRQLTSSGVTVQLQAWQRAVDPTIRDDVAIVDALVSRLGSSVEVVPTPQTLRAAVESMVGVGAVLASRFHALIAASAAGVPSVAVTHEPKLAALARRLEQRTAPVDADPAVLAAEVRMALRGSGPAPAAIKEQIERAEEGFRLLRVLLTGGRSDEADTLGALPLAPSLPTLMPPRRPV